MLIISMVFAAMSRATSGGIAALQARANCPDTPQTRAHAKRSTMPHFPIHRCLALSATQPTITKRRVRRKLVVGRNATTLWRWISRTSAATSSSATADSIATSQNSPAPLCTKDSDSALMRFQDVAAVRALSDLLPIHQTGC